MDKFAPFFSVVICTYNRSRLISRALDSLLLQTCKDWECIIVDDGSTDSTSEMIKPYLFHSTQIKYIHRLHHGVGVSKNFGIQASIGRYVTFLDSDDEYKNNHLAIRKQFLLKHPDTDLLHSNAEIISNQYVLDKTNLSSAIAIENCIISGTFVLRKNSIDHDDCFHNFYSDDSAFFEKFSSKNKVIRKINSPTYIYHRNTENSICTTMLNNCFN